jgi:hypothetical protein
LTPLGSDSSAQERRFTTSHCGICFPQRSS